MPHSGKDEKQRELFYPADGSINWGNYFQSNLATCSKVEDAKSHGRSTPRPEYSITETFIRCRGIYNGILSAKMNEFELYRYHECILIK